MMGRDRSRGFTLIELLVVIAVIALLVAILMPTLNQAKELALRAKCAAQIRSVALGIRTYAEDSNLWMPYDGNNGNGPKMSTNGGLPNRLGQLWAKYGHPDAAIETNMGHNPGLYWQYMAGITSSKPLPSEYADYVPAFENLYCPAKEYTSGTYGGWGSYGWANTAGYSLCIPGSVTHFTGVVLYRYRVGDWKCPWRGAQGPQVPPIEWKAMNDLFGANYHAWVACNREDLKVDDPHRGKGNNFAFRDGSVQFINTNGLGNTEFDMKGGLAWVYANLVYEGLPVPEDWKRAAGL